MYEEQRMKNLEFNLKQYINNSLFFKIDTQGAYLNDIIKHSERVATISLQIAKALNLSESQQNVLFEAAIFHDIGKAYIPKNILFKAGQLNEYERCMVKSHASVGSDYLKKNGYPAEIIDAAKYHHEKYDGTGYPTGISGHGISLFARIISVADSYDAIVSPRVYKESKNTLYALNEILRCRSTQFDPEIVDCFVRVHKKKDALPIN
ncbi:MAG: HD domain-containing protein [Mobilitalea sp.]